MSVEHARSRLAEVIAWEAVSRSADFGRPYPVELPVAEDGVVPTTEAIRPGKRSSSSPRRS